MAIKANILFPLTHVTWLTNSTSLSTGSCYLVGGSCLVVGPLVANNQRLQLGSVMVNLLYLVLYLQCESWK